jgi:hypothetical protein
MRAPGPASNPPTIPEPSFSERARTLLHLGRIGSLSTLSRKQPGFSFGSVMPYGLDDHGRPIFLISTMAMHTQNLLADPRARLLVTQPDAGGDPLGARVTLVGNVLAIPQPEAPESRNLYLTRYANSKYWVDFEDFSFYRMDVLDVYYVGGFGVMGWVVASEYEHAQPDGPLGGLLSFALGTAPDGPKTRGGRSALGTNESRKHGSGQRLQFRRLAAMPRGFEHRNICQLLGRVNAPQHEPAAAHVSTAHKLSGKD